MQAVGRTDQGAVREINQDAIFTSTTPIGPLPNLFVVADGMGGHNAGDFASQFLIRQLVEHVCSLPQNMPEIQALQEGIQTANRLLYEKSLEDIQLDGMGTTLVAAVFCDGLLYVANVGDSRLYVIGSKIRQITRDHSYVEEMVALGRMDRGSEEYLRNKNIITRAAGTARTVRADYFEAELEQGEIVLLCSDGLTNMVEDRTIQKIVKNAPSLDAAARILVDRANDNGGLDNISVVLVNPTGSGVKPC
ncbi:MAG: Stp1/IreP family PP2C-type Ser/Thr phosphatase [Lachnospiraceae bacterium]|nr:Stp1/IreP family PP2C-type Ser/Thr phosphatase [Lachnospiraceae bacterium]MDO5549616.1 Stp1/IreP family PP2C-type Ser/Thr phosphatase [Lachnospiraceae bacterium]